MACALIAGLFILTLAGTLEQGSMGVYQAQQKYFESLVVWIGPVPVFPGGFTLMALLGVNLTVGAFIRRRTGAGLFLVHGGVLLLLAGGMIAHRFSDEGRVILKPGETASAFESHDEWELVIADMGRPGRTTEYIIDQKRFADLASGKCGVFKDKAWPFEVELSNYLFNCEPRLAPGARDQIEGYTLRPLPPEKEAEANAPGLRVTVRDKENKHEGWMWGLQRGPLSFETEDKAWSVGLRRRQYPLPFTLTLTKFVHENHPGTRIASLYQSDLTLIDGASNMPVSIRMNEPLRHKGLTFFQSSYFEESGATGSVLAVVRNPLERLPLWACVVITIGLFMHFGRRLAAHLKRIHAALILIVCFALTNETRAADPNTILTEQNEQLFGWLPIQDQGRVKPMSTFARFKLIQFSGRSTLDGESATRWLMRVIFFPRLASDDKIFLVENPRVMQAIGLPDEDPRARFSFSDVIPHKEKLAELVESAYALPAADRDLVQRQIINLYGNLMGFQALASTMEFVIGQHEEAPELKWAVVPPAPGEGSEWSAPGEIVSRRAHGDEPSHAELSYVGHLIAIQAALSNPQAFTGEIKGLVREALATAEQRGEKRRLTLERLYYAMRVPIRGAVFFMLGFVAIALVWMIPKWKYLYAVGLLSMILGIAVAVAGIVLRCMIQGRPPVTNLFETTLFVPAAAAILALGVEWFDRRRIAAGLGSLLGAVGLFIAAKYELKDGADTMGSLVAVLNSNFWLTTHVVTVTLGYSAGLLAAALGHIYIVSTVMRGRVKQEFLDSLTRMTYGVVCFTLLFSLLGTVLGGIWANDSWGRFWGWDPKENGALLIVLWCLGIVHARAGGYVQQTGMAIGAIGLGMVVVFSWWGVNLLGIGLHSYGFTSGILGWLIGFWVFEIIVIAVGAFNFIKSVGLAPSPAMNK